MPRCSQHWIRRSRLAAFAGLAASTALAACPALGQQAPASPDAGEIIVTATKRSESLQNVPISIQALTTENLAQHEVTSFDDYAKLLPSVSFQSYGPSQSQLFFRGISTAGDGGYGAHGGSLPASGLYIDEIPVTTIGNAVDLHVYDIARVEALAGPQGTLFGASSLSGTLRIITNQPSTKAFSAGYNLEGNKFGKGAGGGVAEAFVNVPLSDKVAIRLVGFYEHDGGFIDNVPSTRTYTLGDDDPTTNVTVNNARFVKNHYNDVDTYGGRAALKVDLDENWTLTPAVIYQHQVANGSFLYDPAEGDLKINQYAPEKNADRWYQASLTLQGKLGNWDVTYAGGYFERAIDTQADYSYYTVEYDTIPGYTKFTNADGTFLDPTQLFSGRDRYTKQTHELRIASPRAERVRLVAGMFYQRQTDQSYAEFKIPGLSAIPGSPAVPTFPDDIFGTNINRVDRDYAAFGEVAVDILPSLTLTGGIRGFIARNTLYGFSGFQSNAASAACAPSTETDIPCANVNTKTENEGETHKANLTWRVDPNHLVYATYSTGFRPGGSNRRPGVNPYVPDTLTNYEIGWKTSWFHRRLFINGAAFIEDWDKLQYGLSPVGSAGVINIYNAGNAEVKGIESDITWHIGTHLILSGAGTYIDAKLTTNFCQFDASGNPDCTSGVIAAPSGTKLPIQPDFKVNATARYEFDVGRLHSFLQGVVLHQSGTRSYLTVREANLLGSTRQFTTFDFSGGIAQRNWTADVFIQNAFDERGELSINTVCVPTICGNRPRIYPVKPQLFGIRVGQRF